MTKPIDINWTTADGLHDGGVSTGIGFTIAWQRGPLQDTRRNGAMLLEVLMSCRNQLAYFQQGPYKCAENAAALDYLIGAIELLEQRRSRRLAEGKHGTSEI